MEDSTPDYVTLAEAAALIGISKQNLYYHLGKHHIVPRHFGGRSAYILRSEAQRLKNAREQPWKNARSEEQDVLAAFKEMSPDLRAQALVKLREMVDTEQPERR